MLALVARELAVDLRVRVGQSSHGAVGYGQANGQGAGGQGHWVTGVMIIPQRTRRRQAGRHGDRMRLFLVEGRWTHLLRCCWTVNSMLSVHDEH